MSHDHKGYSEEKCTRCGWVMGSPPLNCNNDNTPHEFPSHAAARKDERERIRRFIVGLTTTPETRNFAETILWHIGKEVPNE